jgi:hypothetical protein
MHADAFRVIRRASVRARRQGRPSFPVPLKTYDDSIAVLRRARRREGRPFERLHGCRVSMRLLVPSRRRLPEADVTATIAHERAISPSLAAALCLTIERPKPPAAQGATDLFSR